VAFVSVEFRLSERTACKLLGVERSSYRYEPRPDRNIERKRPRIAPVGWGSFVMDSVYERRVWSGGSSWPS
jgi:hypothetical protein